MHNVTGDMRTYMNPVRYILLVLVLLMVLESAVRIYMHVMPAGQTVYLHKLRDGYNPPALVFDDYTGYLYKPHASSYFVRHDFFNVMTTNNYGFRDEDFSLAKSADILRVAVLGDSYLAANQVPVESIWISLLERGFGSINDKKVEFYNFGLDGYQGLNQERLMEKIVLQFSPDVVIFWGYRPVKSALLYRTTHKDVIIISNTLKGLEKAREQIRYEWMTWPVGMLIMKYSALAKAMVLLTGRYPLIPGSVVKDYAKKSEQEMESTELLQTATLKAQSQCTAIGVIYRGKAPADEKNPAEATGTSWRDEYAVLPDGYKGLGWEFDAHFDYEGHKVYADKIKPLFHSLIMELLDKKNRLPGCNHNNEVSTDGA